MNSSLKLEAGSYKIKGGKSVGHMTISDLSYDEKLATALGNMVVVWSHAERTLMRVIWRCTGIDEQMNQASFYRIPTFESRVKYVRALLSEWQTKTYDVGAIDKAIVKLSSLAKARNEWIHGNYHRVVATNKTVRFDFRLARGEHVPANHAPPC